MAVQGQGPPGPGPGQGRKRLGEILVQAGVLAEPQLRAALNEQRRWGGPLGRILVDMNLISEEAMVQALSHQLNLPAVNLDQRHIQPEALATIPAELAEQLGVIPFALQGKFLDLAMGDATNISTIDTLRTRTRLNIRPYLAGPKSIERALAKHYSRGVGIELDTRGPQIIASASGAADNMPLNTRLIDSFVGPLPAAATAPAPTTDVRRDRELVAELAARDLERGRELTELRARVTELEALLARDEDVLRKLLALVTEKGLVTREELRERMK
jgi:Type II secretion system (T2SS), protein E, N-terminal domain